MERKIHQKVTSDLVELHLTFCYNPKKISVNNVLTHTSSIFTVMIMSSGKNTDTESYNECIHSYKKRQAEDKNMKGTHQNMAILGSQIIDNFFTVLCKKKCVCSELSAGSTQNIPTIYNRGEKNFMVLVFTLG